MQMVIACRMLIFHILENFLPTLGLVFSLSSHSNIVNEFDDILILLMNLMRWPHPCGVYM